MMMMIKKIVSFLPSATELLYELGAQDELYGVTHECRYPPDAASKPQVISSVIASEKMSSAEIDAMTSQLLENGKDIFVLNEKNLKDAKPDLIISQKTCKVCAAYDNQVDRAVRILSKKPVVYSMDPHNLQEIIDSVTELGKILGREPRAEQVAVNLKQRIQNINTVRNMQKPRILAIEWIEPLFTAGHWIPEMIQAAGGINMISKTGEHSRRLGIQEIIESDPDMIIVMPCGFDTGRTVLEYGKTLAEDKRWNSLRAVRDDRVFAVDANSFFSKPSIRTVEGIEILAKIIQPGKFDHIEVSRQSYSKITR